ncbi:GntR family transcriptional regulator [Breznakia sp. PF5-3]|uniref:GntR family transcriptional regulator n=1 Tax=unclassified Breznakia TaxID=2623764 RepID=UPI002404ADCD|nr:MULTISPECIES: GntR family transcriptional regulator [unclassified Breznakia]MDF9824723.1 GntR family transcriptional regulator [Breznakia sp. PM6-1]MDF9835386.1 GntR family transcriptional regulator [Breznakia sp. PF5-3]MDF9836985.1 GntR family transcriptional regulator [Breznakia sp. PFB2-8]MDF9859621.1 GntR family transcriptional regulator [Breznakia sp. PH5-24]
MNFDPNIPIYLQIMDEFKKNIVSNNFTLGSKVKSVRDLAIEYGVNPNTVQRALSELEREGLLRSERTSGRYISDDEELIKKLKVEQATAIVDRFISDMRALGFTNKMIMETIEKSIQKDED